MATENFGERALNFFGWLKAHTCVSGQWGVGVWLVCVGVWLVGVGVSVGVFERERVRERERESERERERGERGEREKDRKYGINNYLKRIFRGAYELKFTHIKAYPYTT